MKLVEGLVLLVAADPSAEHPADYGPHQGRSYVASLRDGYATLDPSLRRPLVLRYRIGGSPCPARLAGGGEVHAYVLALKQKPREPARAAQGRAKVTPQVGPPEP